MTDVLRHTALFRRLLQASANPGKIIDCSDIASQAKTLLPINPLLELVIKTVTDVETSVYFEDDKLAKRLSGLTHTNIVPADQADFIVIPTGASVEVIDQAKVGSLIAPHESATIILEVEALEPDGVITMTGPGIETSQDLGISSLSWLDGFIKKNCEFPCGIDIFLIDQAYQLVAMLRTTKVGGSWAM